MSGDSGTTGMCGVLARSVLALASHRGSGHPAERDCILYLLTAADVRSVGRSPGLNDRQRCNPFFVESSTPPEQPEGRSAGSNEWRPPESNRIRTGYEPDDLAACPGRCIQSTGRPRHMSRSHWLISSEGTQEG